ncbi:MAG: hypothetical protein LBE91_12140 [Tannerella sp.]|nr:hypothetical protein [Tannerella sp.]
MKHEKDSNFYTICILNKFCEWDDFNEIRDVMMKTNILKYATILLLLIGCVYSCGEEEFAPFIEIGKGSLGGSEGIPKQEIIIKSKEEWDNLKAIIGNSQTNSFIETEIDFGEYQIIAVFDEIYDTGGRIIYIKCITEYSDKIVITVISTFDGNFIAPTVQTQPYHIVKTPISTKRIEFNMVINN